MAIRLVEIDIAEPIPSVSLQDSVKGCRYKSAQVMVRVYGCAIGYADLLADGDGVSASSVAEQIWEQRSTEIRGFFDRNGLPAPDDLTLAGCGPGETAVPFVEMRRRVLASPPSFSVVIATRDRPESAAETIDAVLALEYPDFEVIVVDNAPTTDATKGVVKEAMAHDSRLRYVREPRPGLSRARNCGLGLATGECVAFTDDDILPDPHWLTEVARGFASGDKVGCVTGLIAPRELETRAQILLERAWAPNRLFVPRLFDLGEHRHENPLFPYAAGLMGGGGANMSFKTDVLRGIGAFDEALGAGTPARGGEDLDALYRIIMAGYQVAYEPSAIIYHAHYPDYETLHRQLYGYGFGLSAYLTKTMLSEWRRLGRLVSLVPRGILYAFSPTSHKNRHRDGSYPRQLAWHEFWGMVNGPLGYLRSRRAARRELSPGR